ncbi:MAG TPA: hypothetical protein VF456_21775 [Vicinamibacterales bacterium]
MRNVIACLLLCVGLVARPVFCQDLSNSTPSVAADAVSVEIPETLNVEALTEPLQTPPAVPPQQPAVHPVAVDYGHAYDVRADIHRYASYTMLPMFGAQIVVGQKLRNEVDRGERTSGGLKGAHTALATGIVGLFALNTVTGVWNLVESRNDPNQRGLRLAHSLLMLGADAGFVATAMITPNSHEQPFSNGPHRTIALTSMGVATASYLIMLIGNR